MRLALAAAPLLVANAALAEITIVMEEVGPDVVVTAFGTADLDDLTLSATGNSGGTLNPATGSLEVGPVFVGFDQYDGVTGPASYGPGGFSGFADSGSGGLVGVLPTNGRLRLPSGYVSQTQLFAEMTFLNESFASLGVTPGVYQWTWGSGADTDRLTLRALEARTSKYTLEIAAREGDTIGGEFVQTLGGVDLADNGLVAFAGGTGTRSVVWSPTAVLAAQGDPLGGDTLTNFSWATVQVNNGGDVAVAGFGATNATFTSIDGKVGGAGAVIDGQTLTNNVGASIFLANDGTVYFFNEIDDGRNAVFTQTSLLVADGDVIDSTTIVLDSGFTNDSIDVDGNGVPYLTTIPASGIRSVFTPNALVVTDGDSFGPDTLCNINTSDFAVSDSGDVAVTDNCNTRPTFVTGVSGAVLDENTVVDGETVGGVFDIDVNSDGTVAFRSGSGGVFTQDCAVLRVGETLDGLRFVEAGFSAVTINDLGQIAFIATFLDPAASNQFQAVILATPTVCVADLDGDNATLLSDFGIFAGNFGQAVPPGTGGDYDGDGQVLLNDFGVFSADFGCTP